jgi:hypothetical protein
MRIVSLEMKEAELVGFGEGLWSLARDMGTMEQPDH